MKKNMDPLDEIGNRLQGLKKENPFKVPEHYFDSLGIRVSDHVHANSVKEPEIIPLWTKLKPILAYSSGFAGLTVVLYLGISLFWEKHQTSAALSKQEVAYNYAYSLVSDIDEATLIENFSTETKVSNDSIRTNTEKDPIIDYLVKENVDMNTIIDAL